MGTQSNHDDWHCYLLEILDGVGRVEVATELICGGEDSEITSFFDQLGRLAPTATRDVAS